MIDEDSSWGLLTGIDPSPIVYSSPIVLVYQEYFVKHLVIISYVNFRNY